VEHFFASSLFFSYFASRDEIVQTVIEIDGCRDFAHIIDSRIGCTVNLYVYQIGLNSNYLKNKKKEEESK